MATYSPFSSLYYQIMQRLQTEVPEIRWIDQDLGQLDHYEMRPPVSFPCVLLDMDAFAPTALSGNIQLMQGAVSLRLAFDVWSATDSTTPDAWRDAGLAFYELEWKINKALMGWTPVGFSHLVRASTATEKREDNIRVREIRYEVQFEDRSAEPPIQNLGGFMLDFDDDFLQQDFGTLRPNLKFT